MSMTLNFACIWQDTHKDHGKLYCSKPGTLDSMPDTEMIKAIKSYVREGKTFGDSIGKMYLTVP